MLKIPIVDRDGAPAWPDKFPQEAIDKLRENAGPRHFAAQMMLAPDAIERARLDASAIHFYDDEFDRKSARLGDLAQITSVAFYWDPSMAAQKSDSSVCVMVLRDDSGRRAFIHRCIYLKNGEKEKYPLAAQCARVLEFMHAQRLRSIGVEVNGMGSALPEILTREAQADGRSIHVQRVVNRDNKEIRILDAIEPLLCTGRLYAHSQIRSSGLIDEMSDWAPGGKAHDDGLDAIAGALSMPPTPIRPEARPNQTITARTEFATL